LPSAFLLTTSQAIEKEGEVVPACAVKAYTMEQGYSSTDSLVN